MYDLRRQSQRRVLYPVWNTDQRGRAAAARGSASAGSGAPPSFQPPAYQAPPVAPPPPAMPGQRKTSPIVWILVIILGLFVVGAIGVVGVGMFVVHKVHQAGIDPELWQRNPGLAASKFIAATNPDVEVVHVDEGRRHHHPAQQEGWP